ncbi:regulator of chromosome condensation 1/beta-lactamase-inhibitor protein II [Xylariomycetidae sp. FL2044]|nr:regulator of chromosome condensation 1/beta-lactamase-inhibitor protein II [Xylariomycetidae sp. FL2044]
MSLYRAALRQSPLIYRPFTPRCTHLRQWPRYASSSNNPENSTSRAAKTGRILTGLIIAVAAGGAVWLYPSFNKEPPKPREAVIEYEKPRPLPDSKESNRDLISVQHLQVKQSWENPGVYAWGSNTGRVAAPDSKDTVVKLPRRIPYFDGKLLRDLKLDRDFGVAVNEEGDLVQWGVAYSQTNPTPVTTLRGKDLVRIEVSRDRIIALGKNGSVYSIPVAQRDQTAGSKAGESSWNSFWSSPNSISYRELKPSNLGWGESVTDISSGLEHALLLTNKGRVFSAVSSTSDFPSKGQLGIPGLTWTTRPSGPFDQPHEIQMLKGFQIAKVAAGDYHSLALDKDGRVFVFGDNTSGQLGFEVEHEIPFVDGPIPLPFSKIYKGTRQQPKVTGIAAGGANSYFTVDATRIAGPQEDATAANTALSRNLGRVTADTWACGSGIWGSLGTGKWTHVSLGPTKIKPLSGLYEFDEKRNAAVPIRLSHISAGSTHAAAVMDNVTHVDATDRSSHNDTNWGADVVWWGGNEYYQLGTGKRNNVPTPTYIGALDAQTGRVGEMHRFQITPRTTVRLGEGGSGRKVSVEQRVECGRFVTAVYSGT